MVLAEGAEFPTLFRPQTGMEPQGRACPGAASREGTHLVKKAILADKLFPGLSVDSNGEPHVGDQQLGEGKFTEGLRPHFQPRPGQPAGQGHSGPERTGKVCV